MSTVVRPSGPLPPRVYWVRRLLLLAVVLGLLWVVVAVIGGGDDPARGDPQAADASTDATEELTDEATAQTAAETRREKRQARRDREAEQRELQRVQDVSQSLEAATAPCDLTLVQAVPQVTEPAYAGSEVMMRIGLRTGQATACSLAVSPDRLLVAVHSMEDVPVWSSTECPDSVPTREVVLRPHWTATLDLLWSGTRSARRCSADEGFALPGEYVLQVAAITGEPASFEFTLAEPDVVEPPADDDGRPQDGNFPEGQHADPDTDGQQADGDPDDAAADDERPDQDDR
jgi:hypothetical protein